MLSLSVHIWQYKVSWMCLLWPVIRSLKTDSNTRSEQGHSSKHWGAVAGVMRLLLWTEAPYISPLTTTEEHLKIMNLKEFIDPVHSSMFQSNHYCKEPSMGLPKKTIRHLQLVQNVATRVQTETKMTAHITPVLKSHFLSCMLIFKSLDGAGHKDITDMLVQYNPARPLRSGLLAVPRAKSEQATSRRSSCSMFWIVLFDFLTLSVCFCIVINVSTSVYEMSFINK